MGISGLLFIAIFMAGLGLAWLRSPLYGLYTYIAVFYLHPPSRWWGAFLPDLRWSLLAAAVTLIAAWRLKPNPKAPGWLSTTPGLVLLLFTAWLWIQSFWALEPADHREACVLFTKYVILFYLIYRLLDTAEKITWFMLVHVAGCLFLGYLAYNAGGGGRLEGVGGPGIDEANALSMHLCTAVMCGAMLCLVLRGWKQIACIAAMPFVLNGMVLAGSRGSFLALIVGGLTLVLLKPPSHSKLFYTFAALAVVGFLSISFQGFWERMGTITAPIEEGKEVDNSAESRIALFHAQVRMAAEYPLGTGHRGTAILSQRYLDARYLTSGDGLINGMGARSSHNTFMSIWVEQGIPGVILIGALGVWGFRAVRRLRKHVRSGAPPETSMQVAAAAAGLVVVAVAGLFTDYLKAEVQIWLLAMLAALVYVRLPLEQSTMPPPASKKRAPWFAAKGAATDTSSAGTVPTTGTRHV
jgi:O-antigen ligase